MGSHHDVYIKEKMPQEEVFYYLIIATGSNYTHLIPTGLFDGFKGEVIHSSGYHTAE